MKCEWRGVVVPVLLCIRLGGVFTTQFVRVAVLIHEGRQSPVIFMTLTGDCTVRRRVLTDSDVAKGGGQGAELAQDSLQIAVLSAPHIIGLASVSRLHRCCAASLQRPGIS